MKSKTKGAKVLNELSICIGASGQCGAFMQVRKQPPFHRMFYPHLPEFVKITVQINGRDDGGVGPPDLHEF